MAVAAGTMIGHDCDQCGQSMASCDAWIKETGQGCCPACFEKDTHGLLDKFKVIDVADHAQDISNLNRLAAQTVIGFSEHAKAIRQLRAEVSGLIQENALLRGRVEELERQDERADVMVKSRLLAEVMDQARQAVRSLPERVKELEDCVVALEAHLKLRRKPKAQRPKELGTGKP